VRLALSLILLILLFGMIDRQALLDVFLNIRPVYYIGGVLLYLGVIGLSAIRWQLILQTAGEPVNLWRLVVINFVGSFFNIFLPTAAGGDLARMYELSNSSRAGAHNVSSVLLDRLIGLASLVIIALVAVMVGFQYVASYAISLMVIGLTLAMIVGWALFFNRRFMRQFRWTFRLPVMIKAEAKIRQLYDSLHDLQQQPRLMLSTFIFSFIVQMLNVVSAILIARALGIQVSALYFFIFYPITWVITMIPLSVNGLGLREGAFLFLFGQVGVTSSEAVALSLLVYSTHICSGILGGLLFLHSSFTQYVPKPANQSEQTP
jgi:hypothetical protein